MQLITLFLILFFGLLLRFLLEKIRVPALIGYLALGMALGALGLTGGNLGVVSADLRRIALVVILLRAGLSVKLSDLKKSGFASILLCFLPALAEMCAVGLLAPLLFGLTTEEGFLLGSVLAAVSPAVVVPRMLRLAEEGYGAKRAVPQTLTAGASADDIFVVLMFGIFLSAVKGEGFTLASLWKLPVSVLCGVALGVLAGIPAGWACKKLRLPDWGKFILLLSLSFLLAGLESVLDGVFPFSGLLGVMALGMTAAKVSPRTAEEVSPVGKKVWNVAEIFLFTLVGAAVSLSALWNNLALSLLLLFCSLAARSLGVFLCTLGTSFNGKERAFAVLSYLPKATVQAAIGGIALAEGLACGDTVLSVAVAAILVTAPLGALLIDLTGKKLLKKD